MGPVSILRLHVHSESDTWAILSEVSFWAEITSAFLTVFFKETDFQIFFFVPKSCSQNIKERYLKLTLAMF